MFNLWILGVKRCHTPAKGAVSQAMAVNPRVDSQTHAATESLLALSALLPTFGLNDRRSRAERTSG